MTATATDATPRSQMVSRKCGAGLSGSNDVLGESPVPDSKDILAQDVSSIAMCC
jgi:hypothetical protein